MTLHLPATRAAEEFARALDGTAPPEVADRYAGLVATATLLREQPAPTPRPAFVADLRDQLMAAAETELRPMPSVVTALPRRSGRSRVRERQLGAAAAAAVLVATTAGVAAAADGALPGDTLYPIKRGIEKLQVSMTTNDAARGTEHLRQASTRLVEVEGLIASDGTAEEIASTLADFTNRADEGSQLIFRSYQRGADPDDISTVREFTATQSRQIEELSDLAPATSTSDLGAAAALLAEIDQQARVLCSDCSGAPAVSPSSLTRPGVRDAMNQLVAAPVDIAMATLRDKLPAGLAQAAKLAEEKARETPPDAVPDTPDTTAPPSGGVSGATPVSTSRQPVTDLVENVTSSVPLTETVRTVTQPLDKVAKSVTGSVAEPLTGMVDDAVDDLDLQD